MMLLPFVRYYMSRGTAMPDQDKVDLSALPPLDPELEELTSTLPSERTATYRHTRCGQQTTIASIVAETLHGGNVPAKLYCIGCVGLVPTHELVWAPDGSRLAPVLPAT